MLLSLVEPPKFEKTEGRTSSSIFFRSAVSHNETLLMAWQPWIIPGRVMAVLSNWLSSPIYKWDINGIIHLVNTWLVLLVLRLPKFKTSQFRHGFNKISLVECSKSTSQKLIWDQTPTETENWKIRRLAFEKRYVTHPDSPFTNGPLSFGGSQLGPQLLRWVLWFWWNNWPL